MSLNSAEIVVCVCGSHRLTWQTDVGHRDKGVVPEGGAFLFGLAKRTLQVLDPHCLELLPLPLFTGYLDLEVPELHVPFQPHSRTEQQGHGTKCEGSLPNEDCTLINCMYLLGGSLLYQTAGGESSSRTKPKISNKGFSS